MSKDETLNEIAQRSKRIETRLTQLMIAQGINTRGQKPRFEQDPASIGRVVLPSRHSSIDEALGVVPAGYSGPVELFVDGTRLAVLARRD